MGEGNKKMTEYDAKILLATYRGNLARQRGAQDAWRNACTSIYAAERAVDRAWFWQQWGRWLHLGKCKEYEEVKRKEMDAEDTEMKAMEAQLVSMLSTPPTRGIVSGMEVARQIVWDHIHTYEASDRADTEVTEPALTALRNVRVSIERRMTIEGERRA
jgi:hypothetical protein